MKFKTVGVAYLHGGTALFDMDLWNKQSTIKYVKDSNGKYINLDDKLRSNTDSPRYDTKNEGGRSIYYDMRANKPVVSDDGAELVRGKGVIRE